MRHLYKGGELVRIPSRDVQDMLFRGHEAHERSYRGTVGLAPPRKVGQVGVSFVTAASLIANIAHQTGRSNRTAVGADGGAPEGCESTTVDWWEQSD